jgi:hypothetical protein
VLAEWQLRLVEHSLAWLRKLGRYLNLPVAPLGILDDIAGRVLGIGGKVMAQHLITVACGVGNLWMAIGLEHPTDSQRDVMATMSTVWKMGFGSMVGLVGAKAA